MTQKETPLDPAPVTARNAAGFGTGIREDLLHRDPLLDCLVELTRIHGRPSTRAALSAGFQSFFIVQRNAMVCRGMLFNY